MKKFYALLKITITISAFSSVNAQWTTNTALNTPICTATGKQNDPRIISDEKGGAFIVWKDFRTGIPDVYVQRVDRNGNVKWTVDGVGACTHPSDQSTPGICTDMNGGCIVAWSDWRSGIERDLYAQRLDSNGTLLWAVNGAVVTTKVEREHNERIISDGAGGCIVAWEQASPFGWDVWSQRLNSTGNAVWVSGGIPVVTVGAYRINARIEEDGKNGAYIVWQDYRNGVDHDIYAQHLSPSGARLFGNAGLAISTTTGTQAEPKIDPEITNGGFYVAWIDGRNGSDMDIYAQRVDSTGLVLWTTNGLPVVAATGNQSAVDILTDPGNDGMIATWKDRRSGNFDIYTQRLNPSGAPQWTLNGVAICTASGTQKNPNIIEDRAGGAIIAWEDSTTGNFDIRAQRISNFGTLQWTINGADVSTAINDQTTVKHCPDGNGGAIFCFMDKRTGTNDIYAHHLFANGTAIGIHEEENPFSQIKAYPNPFNQQVEVSFHSLAEEEIALTLTDATGRNVSAMNQQVFHAVNGDNNVRLVFSDEILPGYYILNLISKGKIASIPLVKVNP